MNNNEFLVYFRIISVVSEIEVSTIITVCVFIVLSLILIGIFFRAIEVMELFFRFKFYVKLQVIIKHNSVK